MRRHQIPILAPSRWLRQADPLPHSWDVTSDSIAAWVAGEVGARRLILVKPPGVGFYTSDRMTAPGWDGPAAGRPAVSGLVDAYFSRALPESLAWTIVPLDELEMLPRALGRSTARDAPWGDP